MADSPVRRARIAAFALACAALLLRPQLAQSLVVRGDEHLYRGAPKAALRYYRRALWLEPADETAIDRLLFGATLAHDQRAAIEGVEAASRYLDAHPDDARIRWDRAMANRALHRNLEASRDFAIAGARTGDAVAFALAGFSAWSAGRSSDARGFWRRALALRPTLPAVRHALARTGKAS